MKNIDYLFSGWNKVKRALNGRFIYLFLDYDGTLAPIAKTPARAFMSKETRELLRRLSKRPDCKLAIISGRRLKDIEGRVGLKNDIVYVGNHGFEIKGADIKFKRPVPIQYRKTLEEIKDNLETQLSSIRGVFVEDKGFSLSVHYRLADKKNIRRIKAEFYAALLTYERKKDVRVKPGKMVFEIKPPLAWDKGKVVLWLLAQQRFTMKNNEKKITPLYIGDDIADEDAFSALKNRKLTIRVGKSKKTNARYYLKNITEVTGLLRLILRTLNQSKKIINNNLTDFDRRVYRAVSKISKGETRSYKWVAAKIGRPKAYRAVGNALNKNPYLGKVPCHRVIRSDGSIGGFAKGTRRKKLLLKAEQKF